MINAEIIADSLNIATGDRLTTFKVRCPKWIIAEIGTHRALSRSWTSSRAVPTRKLRQMILKDPVAPIHWGANQKGMQAKEELSGLKLAIARFLWLSARYPACLFHWLLGDVVGLHKQICNRLVEPWMWADGVITGTEWKNFFKLRNHPDAQPEFGKLASIMQVLYETSLPAELRPGEWHLPFVRECDRAGDWFDYQLVQISSARCARASYYLHDGKLSDPEKDLELCDRLAGSNPKHLSPMEHPAMASATRDRCGNFVGWKQYRKTIAGESGGDYVQPEAVEVMQ